MRIKKAALAVSLALILLLVAPARYFVSVREGVSLFVASVLPSMLPFFFFTKIFTFLGGAQAISMTFGKPVSKMYSVSPICSYAFIMSVLSGYPVGARVLADLYEKGLVDKEDVLRASAFTSTSGSMFILGCVGSVILDDLKAAWIILISHYLGAILNGIIYSLRKRKDPLSFRLLPISYADNVLSEAMYESVLSLALVGGFIAITNLMADMASDVIAFLGLTVSSDGGIFSGVFYSFFEVTRGCIVFSGCGAPTFLITALCAGAISFGGLSVVFQTMAFLGKSGIRGVKILLRKASQAIITFVLCLGVSAIFL